MQNEYAGKVPFNGDVLTIGFGVTVAMWACGYVLHLPRPAPPNAILLAIVALLMVLGGFLAGRLTRRGWRGGMYCGLVTGLLNLLLLGGILSSRETGSAGSAALLWAPLSILVAMACGAAGAWLGRRGRARATGSDINWPAWFAVVTAAATVLLLSVGGMVTGYEAGLAVPDWPNSFGYNMFLYPIVDMPGGVYFEHAHRLLGSLVGLTTVVLAIYVWRVDARRWLRRLALVAVVMVAAQGLLGGLRVTGRLTLSQDAAHLSPSTVLAVVHGVFGQVFLATLVAVATFLSTPWLRAEPPAPHRSAGTDRRLGGAAVALLLIQLVAGALVRHLAQGVVIHITLAGVVLAAVALLAARSWALYEHPIMQRLGKIVLAAGALQVLLGIAAVVAIMLEGAREGPAGWQVLVTTAHQTLGAVLLLGCVDLLLWNVRICARCHNGMLPVRGSHPGM